VKESQWRAAQTDLKDGGQLEDTLLLQFVVGAVLLVVVLHKDGELLVDIGAVRAVGVAGHRVLAVELENLAAQRVIG
jgi:hypothetical protein